MVGDDSERLSRIVTMWTVVRQAHEEPSGGSADAQRVLMERYCAAVHRYLLGALRDEHAADELFQEFALRFLRGDFRRAAEDRGRFRDYVRTVLIHLVNDHHRARRQHARPLPENVAAPAVATTPEAGVDDASFIASWRAELINHAWRALEATQRSYHAVLLFHVNNPTVESSRAAEELSAALGKPMTATNVRVTLHRARQRYAELLLGEVARSLGASAGPEDLAQELKELNLLGACREALEKRSAATAAGSAAKGTP